MPGCSVFDGAETCIHSLQRANDGIRVLAKRAIASDAVGEGTANRNEHRAHRQRNADDAEEYGEIAQLTADAHER
ncbi:MAG: hypothetical protein ABS52_07055 [Gemmatimonadetes bacterium SCN 70-22]|nr:MAG: hypothetical protein ABS52_07055 [Gemmatimonadetes bacterium SCN 70-22]